MHHCTVHCKKWCTTPVYNHWCTPLSVYQHCLHLSLYTSHCNILFVHLTFVYISHFTPPFTPPYTSHRCTHLTIYLKLVYTSLCIAHFIMYSSLYILPSFCTPFTVHLTLVYTISVYTSHYKKTCLL